MAVAYIPGTEPPPMYGHNGPPGTQIPPQSQPPIAVAYPASSSQYHPP